PARDLRRHPVHTARRHVDRAARNHAVGEHQELLSGCPVVVIRHVRRRARLGHDDPVPARSRRGGLSLRDGHGAAAARPYNTRAVPPGWFALAFGGVGFGAFVQSATGFGFALLAPPPLLLALGPHKTVVMILLLHTI